jgi:hypothetical protein
MVHVIVKASGFKQHISFEFPGSVDIGYMRQEIMNLFLQLKLLCEMTDTTQKFLTNPDSELSDDPESICMLRGLIETMQGILETAVKPIKSCLITSSLYKFREVIAGLKLGNEFRANLESNRDTASLNDPVIWWAGRPLRQDNASRKLRDVFGPNEKTTISVTLLNSDDPPPSRESKVDAETYNNILSYMHRRRERLKELDQDDDDSYLCAEWTNPKNLKNTLNGNCGEIKWSF